MNNTAIENIVEEYINSKISIKNLAKKHGIGRDKLTKILKERNVTLSNERRMNEMIALFDKAIPFYLECKSIIKTCDEYKIPTKKLFSEYLKSKGIEVINYNNKVNLNENIFEVIDTEEKAYWLGFLYADGSVTKTNKRSRLELSLKESDLNHIEKFKEFLQSTNKIQYKTTKLGNAYRLNVSSVKLISDLIHKGCVPRKSLILKFPSEEIVPRKLIRHFMRGYFEGDGWLGFDTTGRYHRCNIVGTYDFIVAFCKVLNMDCERITSKGKAYQYEFKRSQVKELLKFMYSDCNIYLERKYQRYKQLEQ